MMKNPCPRCTQRDTRLIVTTVDGENVEIEGALSRADNKTEICSACGLDEAMLDYEGPGCQPISEWPIVPKYHALFDRLRMARLP